ncbi:MAG: glycosyltransferase [Lentisphaeria bacterium]|nr:glycosyltransferase [Lentisphaeria bacterium]
MNETPLISVVIPAHNEEKYIASCLESVKRAAARLNEGSDCVETVVVANRCTDRTAEIARSFGAEVVENDARCIAQVRNAGVRASRGGIVVTVDADSAMSELALCEVREMLESGRYIGGGTPTRFDRMSVGIFFSAVYVAWNLIPVMLRNKAALSGGMFWFYRRDFEAAGGFDESLVSLEDMDFAARLNKLGVSMGKKYGTLKKSYIVTSARKFDMFGDWYLIRNRKLTKRIFTGRDREAADAFYYDVR